MNNKTKRVLSILGLLLVASIAACSPNKPALPIEEGFVEEVTPTEVTLVSSPTPPPPTSTQPPTPTATLEPSPTATAMPVIRVSENTNCRRGPGPEYLFQGVLTVGEEAEVLGRSEDTQFWLIANPDKPGEKCWLWGEFAQIVGGTEGIAVITPAPSPTPLAGFEVYVKSFIECSYAKMIVFAVRNAGSQRIWSGYVDVQDLGTGESLYKARERHPFAGRVEPACPPDHGNELWPGETRYIHVPVSLEYSGIEGVGIITLCTADHQGGTCITEYSYFVLP